MPHGAPAIQPNSKEANSIDPFTRKSSVKKIVKNTKKQQGSSRFKTTPVTELQPLTLLKGITYLFSDLY